MADPEKAPLGMQQEEAPKGYVKSTYLLVVAVLAIVAVIALAVPLGLAVSKDDPLSKSEIYNEALRANEQHARDHPAHEEPAGHDDHSDHAPAPSHFSTMTPGANVVTTANPCVNKKPIHSNAAQDDEYFKNQACMVNGVIDVLEQAATNVTPGYAGNMVTGDREPIGTHYWEAGLCPVNVHWHLGAEHMSDGEYDNAGSAPGDAHRKLQAGEAREGHLCHYYDDTNPAFTTEYNWEHCVGMHVGNTYEVHWPHSAAGACGTPYQYQTPFYDGVFCNDGIISLSPLNTYQKIGVQGQVFTIINDESYYYPDLIRGMIVDGERGQSITTYTGSTTGTSRDNETCSKYTPITWQVDTKCHLISASSFDKMCADMKAQLDDMSDDLYAHGSRELVADDLAADNHGNMA